MSHLDFFVWAIQISPSLISVDGGYLHFVHHGEPAWVCPYCGEHHTGKRGKDHDNPKCPPMAVLWTLPRLGLDRSAVGDIFCKICGVPVTRPQNLRHHYKSHTTFLQWIGGLTTSPLSYKDNLLCLQLAGECWWLCPYCGCAGCTADNSIGPQFRSPHRPECLPFNDLLAAVESKSSSAAPECLGPGSALEVDAHSCARPAEAAAVARVIVDSTCLGKRRAPEMQEDAQDPKTKEIRCLLDSAGDENIRAATALFALGEEFQQAQRAVVARAARRLRDR